MLSWNWMIKISNENDQPWQVNAHVSTVQLNIDKNKIKICIKVMKQRHKLAQTTEDSE